MGRLRYLESLVVQVEKLSDLAQLPMGDQKQRGFPLGADGPRAVESVANGPVEAVALLTSKALL